MKMTVDTEAMTVHVEDGDSHVTVEWPVYYDAVEHTRNNPNWQSDVALMFEMRVGQLILDAAKLHVQDEADNASRIISIAA